MFKLLCKYQYRSGFVNQLLLRVIILIPIIFFVDHPWTIFAWGTLVLCSMFNFFINPFICMPEALTLIHLTGYKVSKFLRNGGFSVLLWLNIWGTAPLVFVMLNLVGIKPVLYTLFSINIGLFLLSTIGNKLYFSDLWEMKSSFVRSLLSIATIQVFVSIIMGLLFFCKNILLSNPLIMVLFLAICFSLWYLSSNQYSIITHYKFIKTK